MEITFKEEFGIDKNDLEFVNIPLKSDIEVFICPFLIDHNKKESEFSKKIYTRLVDFLTHLNKNYIKPNKRNEGIIFLSHLHEPNEIHFGYSSNNKGKAVAKEKATIIFDALRNNRFAKQGLETTNQAHNVLLLVKGIGQDIMSDITLNICRDIFADFTKKIIDKYNISKVGIFNCEYYNGTLKKWDTIRFKLPKFQNKKIILIPKKIVSGKRIYSTRYNWFVASKIISVELMNKENLSKKDNKLFKRLKSGTKKIIIKRVYDAYKKPKEDLIQFVLDYPGSLDQFIKYAKEHYPEIDLSDLNEK